jgi:MFS family permease
MTAPRPYRELQDIQATQNVLIPGCRAGYLYMIVGVFGPPLGGYLVDAYGFRIMLGAAWLFYFLATIIRVSMARTAARGHEANPRKLTMSNLRGNLGAMLALLLSGGVITWVLVTDGIRDIAYSLSGNLIPVYLQGIGGLSFQQIGWLGSVFSICMMLVTMPAGRLADRRDERIGIMIGFLAEFVAMFALMQVSSFLGYAVVHALFGFGAGMMSPAYNSLISKAVPEKLRGTAFGLFGTSLGIVSLPAPWAGAQLWERFSPRLPFYVTGLAALVSVVPAWLKFKLPKNNGIKVVTEGVEVAVAK